MTKDIVIVGAGGMAKEVAFLLKDINKDKMIWNFLGFIDEMKSDDPVIDNSCVIGNDDWLIKRRKKINVVYGLGSPSLIKKLHAIHKENKNIINPNLIHPTVLGDFKNIKMQVGNILCAGNIFTTDISIGSFNIFNLSCTFAHDSFIGNYNVFNPSTNISGCCKIDNCNLFGTGCKVLQNIEITKNVILGAGSVAYKNILESGTWVGVPAKKII